MEISCPKCVYIRFKEVVSPILQASCQHLRLRIYEYVPKCLKRPKIGRDDVTIEDVARYLE